MGKMVILLKLK
jgi:hypothetical protein